MMLHERPQSTFKTICFQVRMIGIALPANHENYTGWDGQLFNRSPCDFSAPAMSCRLWLFNLAISQWHGKDKVCRCHIKWEETPGRRWRRVTLYLI